MLPSRDLHRMMDDALRLEKLGFDHLRIPDHLIWDDPNIRSPDAWTLLGAIAVKTSRMRLSLGVTDPFRRPSAVLAQAVLTLDHLTQGRAVLGIGAGENMNLVRFGIAGQPSARYLREAITAIRKLWSASFSNPAVFRGRMWTLRGAYLQIQPYGKRIPPIYVGALGPKTRDITGELGDGWYPMPAETPLTFKEHLRDVERGARSAGRSLDEIDRVAIVGTIVSTDRDRAYEEIRTTAAADLLLERTNLESMGYSPRLSREITVQRMDPGDMGEHGRILEEIERIPRVLIDEVIAIGSPDECTGNMEEYLAAGATSIMIYSLGTETASTI